MRAGTGHLEQIGPTWFLRYRASYGRCAKMRRVRLGSSTEIRSTSAARTAADAWLLSQRPETLAPGPRVKAAEYFAYYLETHVPCMRLASQRRYRSVIGHHLVPRFGRLTLERLDAREIQAWIAALAPTHARESVRGLRAILLQILRQAVNDKFAAHRLDSRSIRIPKNNRAPRERRFFEDAELVAILEASPLPWRLLWALMGFAGLRIGEALGLEWQHIDRAARVIKVRQNAVLGLLQPTKTEQSKVDVPIDPALDAILEQVPRGAHGALLFPSAKGTALRSDNVRARQLRPLLARLGIRRAGLHAFRHSLPNRLFGIGASAPIVQRVMRHATLRQTETYVNSGNLDLHAALDRVRNQPR